MLYIGMLGNVARYLYISWLHSPWWVLPFEFLQGKYITSTQAVDRCIEGKYFWRLPVFTGVATIDNTACKRFIRFLRHFPLKIYRGRLTVTRDTYYIIRAHVKVKFGQPSPSLSPTTPHGPAWDNILPCQCSKKIST